MVHYAKEKAMMQLIGIFLSLPMRSARAQPSYEIYDWQAVHQLRRMERRAQQSRGSVWCRYLKVDTMYLTDNVPDSVEELCCVPIVDGKENDDIICDAALADSLPLELKRAHQDEIERGTLIVEHFGAELRSNTIQISDNNPIFRVHKNLPEHLRRLQTRHLEIKPEMSVAVVRISVTNTAPTYSTTEIRTTLLGNGINFLTQYDACSQGKLKWKLANDGIIDVKVNQPISDFPNGASLVAAAQIAMKNSMGISSVADLADKVIMCLPPGTGNWAASAGVNHWRAQMNNDWCLSLTGTMHELGHTMGLLHSNADGKAYNDRSGYMGSGYTETEWPKKCFNGYHSYQFGWYSDHHLDWDVVKDGDRLIDLAAFVDYDQAAENEAVVVNLSDTDYLLYNLAKDHNLDTEQKIDQVTITEPKQDGTDSKAGLSIGDKFEVPNFQNKGKKLVVEACETKKGKYGANVMVVSIALDKSLCGQHPSSISTGLDDGAGESTISSPVAAAPAAPAPTPSPQTAAPITPQPSTAAPVATPEPSTAAPVTPEPTSAAPIITPAPTTAASPPVTPPAAPNRQPDDGDSSAGNFQFVDALRTAVNSYFQWVKNKRRKGTKGSW